MMTKSGLRRTYLSKRKNLDPGSIQQLTQAISANLTAFLRDKSFTTVHIFLTQARNNEVDTLKIIDALRDAFSNLRVAAPFVVPGTRDMLHFSISPGSKFIHNTWQIPEPDPAAELQVLPKEIDVVIIPMLAFDKQGFRVGYGGGFYDRFLPQCRPETWKIGLSFFGPVDKIADLDNFDVPMNACITPDGIFQW